MALKFGVIFHGFRATNQANIWPGFVLRFVLWSVLLTNSCNLRINVGRSEPVLGFRWMVICFCFAITWFFLGFAGWTHGIMLEIFSDITEFTFLSFKAGQM